MNARTPKPWAPWLAILGAIVYGASPLDIIPDLIPLLGLADDATAIVIFLSLAASLFVKIKRAKQLVPATAPAVIDVQSKS
jgi:uncharacterized membrane protein YkvA (DUF1232 family)